MGWGLLQGLGAGTTQVGNMGMQNYFEKEREERLRSYQEELTKKSWDREDAKEELNLDRTKDIFKTETDEEGNVWQVNSHTGEKSIVMDADDKGSAASFAIAQRDGKEYRLAFDKDGNEINRVEIGDAPASQSRPYLDPLVESRIETLKSEISALAGKDFLEPEDRERLEALREERDRIQGVNRGGGSEPSGTPGGAPTTTSRPPMESILPSVTDDPDATDPEKRTGPPTKDEDEALDFKDRLTERRERETQQPGLLDSVMMSGSEKLDRTLAILEESRGSLAKASEDELLEIVASETSTAEQKRRARQILERNLSQ
jgi:hypothetical protein